MLLSSAEIGKRLKEARGNMQMTQLAKELGISVSAVSMYESGQRIPRDELKVIYAERFGTTVGFLFFNEKVN